MASGSIATSPGAHADSARGLPRRRHDASLRGPHRPARPASQLPASTRAPWRARGPSDRQRLDDALDGVLCRPSLAHVLEGATSSSLLRACPRLQLTSRMPQATDNCRHLAAPPRRRRRTCRRFWTSTAPLGHPWSSSGLRFGRPVHVAHGVVGTIPEGGSLPCRRQHLQLGNRCQ